MKPAVLPFQLHAIATCLARVAAAAQLVIDHTCTAYFPEVHRHASLMAVTVEVVRLSTLHLYACTWPKYMTWHPQPLQPSDHKACHTLRLQRAPKSSLTIRKEPFRDVITSVANVKALTT